MAALGRLGESRSQSTPKRVTGSNRTLVAAVAASDDTKLACLCEGPYEVSCATLREGPYRGARNPDEFGCTEVT